MRKKNRQGRCFILLLLLLVVISDDSTAQPRCAFTHYSVEDGLSEGTILSMHQDKNGFLWLGTFDGLNRFDGYSFKVFKAGFKSDNGLTNNRIDRIAEDDLGFLWLLSNDGEFHRFNTITEEFLSFSHMTKSTAENSSPVTNFYCLTGGETWVITEDNRYYRIVSHLNSPYCDVKEFRLDNELSAGGSMNRIFRDKEQTIWFLSDKGLARLVPGQESIEVLSFKRETNEGTLSSFYNLYESENDIWFGSDNGTVRIFSYLTHSFTSHKFDVSSSIAEIHALNSKELLILSSGNGFIVYNILNGDTKQYTRQLFPALPTNALISAYIDRFGEAWIESSADGVTHFDPFTGNIQHFRMKTERTNPNVLLPSFFIFEDTNDNLWVYPRGGGFSFYDRKERCLKYFFNEPGDAARKFPNLIHSAISDSQGNLWMCTISRGLEKITFFPNQFQVLRPNPVSGTHSENEVRALFEDRGKFLWIATKDGSVYLFNSENECLGTLRENGSFNNGPPFNGLIYSIIQDRKGNIWMGSKGRGIFRLTPLPDGTKPEYRITNFRHTSDIYSLSHDNVYSLFEDTYGRIWAGTFNGGLNYLDPNDNNTRFINVFNKLKNYPYSTHKRVRYVTSDFNNHILVGTTNGLIYFDKRFTDPSEIVFNTSSFSPDDGNSLSGNDIHFIYCSRDNEVYLGTFGGGLNKVMNPAFAADKPLFKSYTRSSGAPDDIILSIVDDMDGNLWLSCQRGILKFNKKKESFEIYGSQSGVESRYFSESTGLRRASAEIIMGFDDGIYCFNPSQVQKTGTIAPLLITRVQISGTDISGAELFSQPNITGNQTGTISMQSRQKTLAIEYSALDYRNPNNIQYSHMLEGFDQEWIMDGSHRIAAYSNLQPGSYTFHVRSTNADGIWVDNQYSIPVVVHPSFWQTIFARIMYLVLFLSLTAIVIYIITTFYKLRHKVEVEQLITNLKLKFFTDISHELRTPLTLIASPVGNILKDNDLRPEIREQLSIVQSNTERMLRLVNQILDFRKIQNNKMKLKVELFNLADYIREICSNFTKIAEDKGILFEINDLSDNESLWADKDKVEKIVYNLLSNAFKFTPGGKRVTVTITRRDNSLDMAVADQGSGLTREKLKNLFGRFDSGTGKSISLQPGTGIGLSLSKELADMHKATLTAESEEGQGAVFTISFRLGCSHFENDTEFVISDGQSIITNGTPVIKQDDHTITEEESDNEPLLLIVEDNEELRSFLRIILSDGFHVIEAGNGNEGCQIALSQLPDIIITDLMMPGMNGLELAEIIKKDETTSHIPVIILTAKTDLDTQLEALRQGADDYITKPFSSSYLRARVDNILQQRKKLQELFLSSIPAFNNNQNHSNIDISPITPVVESYDEKFIKRLMDIMEENMDNSELTVDDLVSSAGIGRSVFFKKIKSLTGLAPVEFIREVRIKRAAQLIETGEFTISQVTYMVGNNDPRYFSRIFKHKYGMTPSEYKEKHTNNKN